MVYGTWTVPVNFPSPVPAVVILHGWGVVRPTAELALANSLAKRGVASFIMTLPFHLQRTPPGVRSGQLLLTTDLSAMVLTMKQAICDIQRTVDWVRARPEVHAGRIGIAGVSLGALIGALFLGVDDRWAAAALALGGADLAGILWNSPLTSDIRRGLARAGHTEETVRTALAEVEPTRYLKPEHGRNTYLIGARFDQVIPVANLNRLRDAMGNPPMLWLDTGHFGPKFVYEPLMNTTADFLVSRLNGIPFNPPKFLTSPTIRLGVFSHDARDVRLSIGADLFTIGPTGEGFLSVVANPTEIGLFAGVRAPYGFSPGVALTRRGVAFGVFWHWVL